MAIVYPLTLPTTRGPASASFGGRTIVAVSESPFTMTQQVQEFQGQRWEVDVKLAIMSRADAEAWTTFFLKLKGKKGTFLIGDPIAKVPRGLATGTPLMRGISVLGSESIAVDGLTANLTAWLKAGDYVQIGSGATSRLHKALDDVPTNGSGQADIPIWPSLRANTIDNDPLVITNCRGVFRMNTNVMKWDTEPPALYSMAFGAVEVI